jgi:flagellar FliJ protein
MGKGSLNYARPVLGYVMVKSQRLRPVVKVAEKKERSATLAVVESKRALDEHLLKLEQLKAYLDEYRETFRILGGTGLTIQKIQEYKIFLSNLEAAVAQQHLVVKVNQKTYMDKLTLLMASRGKTKALGIVIARHEQKERQENMRQDQKELDDRPPASRISLAEEK